MQNKEESSIEFEIGEILKMLESHTYLIRLSNSIISKNIENLFTYYKIYEKFANHYLEINELNSKAYALYHQARIKDKAHDGNEEEFMSFFQEKFETKPQYFSHNYWKYDTRTGMSKKESVRSNLPNGFFLKKANLLFDKNTYLAETIQPQFDFTLPEKSEKYLWVYGKHLRTDFTLIRFYFCFNPKKILTLNFVEEVKTQFDDSFIPFALKFHCDPVEYSKRSDTCVLYIPRSFAILTFATLSRVYLKFKDKDFFVNDKPMFTKSIVDGISFGEDPDEKMHLSFGTYKCAIITLSYFKLKIENKPQSLENLISEINNFDPELFDEALPIPSKNDNWVNQFYLNKNSKYDYTLEINYFKKAIQIDKEKLEKEEYLKLAKLIGSKLVSDAFWFENSEEKRMNCNWICYEKNNKNTVHNEFKVLGNDFVNGRLGISFFLRKLYDEIPDYLEFDTTSYRAVKDYLDFENLNSEEHKWFVRNSKFHWTESWRSIFDTNNVEFVVNRRNHFANFFSETDKIVSGTSKDIGKTILNEIIIEINKYLDEGKPFYLFETDELFPTFNGGLAYFGYFFLKLARPEITNIPLKINYID